MLDSNHCRVAESVASSATGVGIDRASFDTSMSSVGQDVGLGSTRGTHASSSTFPKGLSRIMIGTDSVVRGKGLDHLTDHGLSEHLDSCLGSG